MSQGTLREPGQVFHTSETQKKKKKSHRVSNIIPPMISFYLSFPYFSWEQPYLKTKAFISVWKTVRSCWIGRGFQSVQVQTETVIYLLRVTSLHLFLRSFSAVRQETLVSEWSKCSRFELFNSFNTEWAWVTAPDFPENIYREKATESRVHHFWFVWSQSGNE